ncbi:hypothetical protein O4H52_12475 [Sphingomonadaceae bacterium G21617-S1]|jgi:hypothetical protein|uniref:hypothetical protein n=1 Tax=Rhizorhabdus sp. TaxID=1968843 RepID=UPI0019AAA856|nr:hypothetical protein [Rhizorhabdus sp.]MBD3761613.1 hypothetical protein [Rhizorhabdus sp.]MCZ4342427.1 hypothetical protein [Sphingomonadaceae bacterium G21617-S1]
MSEDATRETLKMVATGPIAEMGPPRGLSIGQAKFFKIGIDHKTNGKQFVKLFVKGHETKMLNGDFEAVLAAHVQGAEKIPNRPENSTPAAKGRTNLSLHADSACYVVIELDDGIDWAFSEYSTPFSTTDFDGHDKIFSEPTLCWPDGADGVSRETITSVRAGDLRPRTNWAYFVFDHEMLSAEEQNEFFRGFNIHVGLYPEAGSSRPILITIDPDVGHPGGQGN